MVAEEPPWYRTSRNRVQKWIHFLHGKVRHWDLSNKSLKWQSLLHRGRLLEPAPLASSGVDVNCWWSPTRSTKRTHRWKDKPQQNFSITSSCFMFASEKYKSNFAWRYCCRQHDNWSGISNPIERQMLVTSSIMMHMLFYVYNTRLSLSDDYRCAFDQPSS